jgi:mono/diheme cytochrome c family protein
MFGTRLRHFAAPALCAAALTLAQTAMAQQPGDARRGATLANAWCASCHIVAPGTARRGADRAPPFAAIVSNPAKGPPYIRTWLTRSHVQMPNFDLTRQDMADLVTYMQTLKR